MRFLLPIMTGLLLACASATAAPPSASAPASSAALPEWDRLTPGQRETLIGPMRERWNENTDGRQRMFEHAQRWRSMTPEQRAAARRGMQRFDHMNPEQRERSRALFDRMQAMPPDQRRAFRAQWKTMTPEERHAWIRQNAPTSEPDDQSGP